MDVVLLASGTVLGLALPLGWWIRRTFGRSSTITLRVDGFPVDLVAVPPGAEPPSVVTGDPGFDQRVRLGGDPAVWLAILTPDLRASLSTLVGMGLTLRDGAFTGTVPVLDHAIVADGTAALRSQFALATEPADRIAARWSHEKDPTVRRRIFEWFVARGEPGPLADLAAADPDHELRLRGAEVTADLDRLGDLVTDPAVPPRVRDRAFSALRERSPAELATRLLRAQGPAAALAHERLATLPEGPWTAQVLADVERRWSDPEHRAIVVDTLLALVRNLPEPSARRHLPHLLSSAPVEVARALVLGVPVRLLSPEVVVGLQQERPELAALARSTQAVRNTGSGGPDPERAIRLFAEAGWTWVPHERRAIATHGGRSLSVTLTVGAYLFRLSPVPLGARLVLTVDPSGERHSEVPGTAAALSWFPQGLREVLRDPAPVVQELHVEDGEVRVRADPTDADAALVLVDWATRIADALAALGPLSDGERLTSAFRTAPPGPVRRKLAAEAFAHDDALALAHVDDADPEVRRAAGRHAPHPPTLVALVANPRLPVAVRTVALSDLHTLDDRPSLSAAVGHAWRDGALTAQALGLTGAARLREHWQEVALLVDTLAPARGPVENLELESVRKALYVLTKLEEPASEALLVRGSRSRDPALRRALLTALGRFGTPMVLQELRRAAVRYPSDAAVVDRAIAALRTRMGSGGLAVVEVAGGELAEPTDGLLGAVAEPVEPATPDDLTAR